MNFLYPSYLWGALFLLPYTLFVTLDYRRQLKGLYVLWGCNLTNVMRQAYKKYYGVLAIFFALFWLSLLLALAKPMWGSVVRDEAQRKNLQIIFVLDISRSMLVKDIEPDRLQRAISLLRELYEGFENEELGLVVFKGRVQTLVPLSRDRIVFPVLFPQLHPDIIQSAGSNLAAGIEEALQSFDKRTNASQVILLLSDGADFTPRLKQIYTRLEEWDGTLLSVGVGTSDGGEILSPTGEVVTDSYGLPVIGKLQSEILQTLSKKSLGKYYHIQDFNLAQKIQQQLTPLIRGNRILDYNLRDRYQLFICLAIFCFIVLAFLKRYGFIGFYQLSHQEDKSGNPQSVMQRGRV